MKDNKTKEIEMLIRILRKIKEVNHYKVKDKMCFIKSHSGIICFNGK